MKLCDKLICSNKCASEINKKGLLWWSSGKESSFQCSGRGFDPWSGKTKIPHAAGQLSPHATTIELTRLKEGARVLQTTEPTRSGAHMPQLERSPSTAMKRLHTAMKDPAYLNKDPTCCN